MSTKSPVRVIKNAERPDAKTHDEIKFSSSPNRWSAAVRSWVVEFQKRNHNESLPDFNSLLKDTLREPTPAD